MNTRAPAPTISAISSLAPFAPTLGASVIATPPAFAPALYASHSTAPSARIFAPITIHSADFKRPFITPPPSTTFAGQISNDRDGKRLSQFLQVQSQGQPIVMPQHAAAVRDIARCLIH